MTYRRLSMLLKWLYVEFVLRYFAFIEEEHCRFD